jgi:predicted nucleic acid-binding protein
MAISAITLAELSAGPHEVRRSEQDMYDEHAERARRLEILQRAENEFDPIPFGAEAAHLRPRNSSGCHRAGRKPQRITDLLIAPTAIAEGPPLFTTNPRGFTGLDTLLPAIPVTRRPSRTNDHPAVADRSRRRRTVDLVGYPRPPRRR